MILDRSFPIVGHCIYLNHAAIAPWPRAVIDAARAFVDDNAARGPLNYADWLAVEERLRARLARLVGAASADDISLLKNTSEGLGLVAAGIDWQAGDAVVFPAGEFLSNALPWRALAERGVEVREVPFDPAMPEDALIDAMDQRTRLVAFSSVRYDSGVRLDTARLARAAHDHGALVCVDAIQELGAAVVDVAATGADILVAGSHKWLLCPEGLAVMWTRPEVRRQLRPVHRGWRMWEDMFSFGEPTGDLPSGGRRFEPGTLNSFAIHALDAAAGLFLDTGMETVARAVAERGELLCRGLARMDQAELVTPADAPRRAGIVSFRPLDEPADALCRRLADTGIHAAVRGAAVRLSPHFYTPMEQLERTLEVIGAE